MNIGYACIAIAVPGSETKGCTIKNATEERLISLIGSNLASLDRLIDYNALNGIRLFRISSDLIPFGSSLSEELPWQDIYAKELNAIGNKIKKAGMRVSMHPGQYTVLNSPDGFVAGRALKDLDYHAKVLKSLGLGPENKIILHLGGVYGDKKQSKSRFLSRYRELNSDVKSRLVLENDDKFYNIEDVLDTAAFERIPVVFDNLHNAVNTADKSCPDYEWVKKCSATWGKGDGLQKIHYSQQNPIKRPGAHSESIQIEAFLGFCQSLSGMEIDIMLEVKDKNLSALKCINCISDRGINTLEAEWARYKYCILEHSPETYYAIRKLLRDKHIYPALEMYRMIENSLGMPINIGNAGNAAQHVWGYFKDKASEAEKNRFQKKLREFTSGEAGLPSVKNALFTLSRKYNEQYLLNGYYFYI